MAHHRAAAHRQEEFAELARRADREEQRRARRVDDAKTPPKIENARDRSLWRFNLDHSQYNRCCVPQLPQWPPSSFRWRCILWLRRHRTSDLRRRLALRLDRWPTPRLGSVSCPRLDRLQTSDSRRLFRTSARPLAILQACAWRSWFHRARARQSWFHPACAVWSFLRQGRRPTSDSHRCRPLARLAASSGLRLMLPLPLDWLRLQFAPAASPFAFTGREPLGLRLVAPSPAEPLMHSLFQPNLASTAEPSMSIPFPPALASSGINPVEQPWACALTCNLWCVQRSLCGLRLRFHPLSGLAAILRFSPAVHSVNLAGDQLPACAGCFFFQPSGNQLRCPNGSSVE